VKKAEELLHRIGTLKQVKGCELLDIGHGGQIVMKSWRRSKQLSGGLGLEKCVHDYDLIFHFIKNILGIKINHLSISSKGQRNFWLYENKEKILSTIKADTDLYKTWSKWDNRIFQRIVTDEFPVLEHEQKSDDLIVDQQSVELMLNQSIPITFKISTGGYRPKTERQYEFIGDKGTLLMDMSKVYIEFISADSSIKETYHFDSQDNHGHAGGDYFIVKTFLELCFKLKTEPLVSFEDAIFGTKLGCLIEQSLSLNGQTMLFD